MTLAFGGFRVDFASRRIWRGNDELHLSPKAFDLLAYLVANRPRAIGREELHRALWPDTFVGEASLHGLVAELRRTLRDDTRKPGCVRTLHRFGYGFHGEVTIAGGEAIGGKEALGLLTWPHGRVYVGAGERILGRDLFGRITADTETISRRHARLTVSADGAVLEDLGSKNGTFVGGARVDRPLSLGDGDRFVLGSLAVTFHLLPGDQSTKTAGLTRLEKSCVNSEERRRRSFRRPDDQISRRRPR